MELNSPDILLTKIDDFCCRACLKSGGIGIMHSFTDTADCSDGEKELRDLYQKLTKIEVRIPDKRKPTLICGSCTNKLVTAYEFILDARRAENLLIKQTIFYKNNAMGAHSSNTVLEPNEVNIEIVTNEEPELKKYKVEFLGTDGVTADDSEGAITGDAVVADFYDYESLDGVVNEVELDCEMLDDEAVADDKKLLPENEDDDVAIVEEVGEDEEEKSMSEFEFLDENEVEILGDVTQNSSSKKPPTIGSRLVFGTRHQISCDECQRGFAKLESYQRHKATAHTFAPREEIVAKQPNEQNIFCPFCPRTFVHKNDLVRHVNAIHPEDVAKNPIDVEPKKQKRQYKKATCPHCQKDFPQASIKIHIRRHLGINPYKCDTCDKAFPRKQDLTVHIRQHTGERPHVCSVCAKSFIRPNKLSRHMRIHLGIRPYTCDECGKCFSQSNDLKIHQRRHTGEKPYACYCGESFISGTALRQHRKLKMHTEEDMPDPYDACRVNTRNNKNLSQNQESLEIEEINE